jgi:uncharacterized membrane protein YgaE (UPF0421/DUF939 family)
MQFLPGSVGTTLCDSLQSIGTNAPGAIIGGVGGVVGGLATEAGPFIAGGLLVIIGLVALLREPNQVNISLAKGQK